MSNSSAYDRTRTSQPSSDGVDRRERSSARFLLRPVSAVGFWAAIALPFLYLPLLLSGPTTGASRLVAFGLMAAHVLALLVGHAHRQSGNAA